MTEEISSITFNEMSKDIKIIDIKNVIIKRLIDLLSEMDSNMPRWVSVEEKLPEENNVCLCRTTEPKRTYAEQVIGTYSHNTESWCWINFYTICHIRDNEPQITHWMPLPDPPVDKFDHEWDRSKYLLTFPPKMQCKKCKNWI